MWLISAARNIIVVVVSAVMAYMFEAHGSHPFILTGKYNHFPKIHAIRKLWIHQTHISRGFKVIFFRRWEIWMIESLSIEFSYQNQYASNEYEIWDKTGRRLWIGGIQPLFQHPQKNQLIYPYSFFFNSCP